MCPLGIWCQNDVISTSMRLRIDIDTTSFLRHVHAWWYSCCRSMYPLKQKQQKKTTPSPVKAAGPSHQCMKTPAAESDKGGKIENTPLASINHFRRD